MNAGGGVSLDSQGASLLFARVSPIEISDSSIERPGQI